MSEENKINFTNLLAQDGSVALTIKQSLAPANDADPVIFPPAYPISGFKGRVHTVRDGDYRVSVELPPDSKRDKNEKSSDQRPGYNIDRFPDDTNSCEIDSPQSQANRIEPTFKTRYPDLVPQIEIKVGANGTKVNLLDAGHRAADAVVRLSSLADKFHAAFLDAKAGNQFTLATLAPTSLVFGVWDSRSTQVKMQRIVKAQIRASNVYERTRSAQFTPAVDYVAAGAVAESLDSDTLSEQGMLHALATETVGGVMLTPKSELTRTVALNLAAVRELRGSDERTTKLLQNYILGLALLAATAEPGLNLREGCNLRLKEAKDEVKLVPRRGEPKAVSLDPKEVEQFAKDAALEFFEATGGKMDYCDAVFESGVAEAFLAIEKKEDRDKIARQGPITAATLRWFAEQGKDPFKAVLDTVKEVKKALGKAPGRRAPRVKDLEALKPLAEGLRSLSDNDQLPEEVRKRADELAALAQKHDDSHEALKEIEKALRDLKKAVAEQKSEAAKA
jgi:CRISPR-associated protein Csb1